MDNYRGLPVDRVIKLNHIQKSMAQGMKASLDALALSQVSRELDFSGLFEFRLSSSSRHRESQPFSINTLMMAVTARALVRHPILNAQLLDGQVVVFEPVNLGMAITTEKGLVVAVIREAHRLTLEELDGAIKDLAGRARQGNIQVEDVEGGTFTVSNLGMLGIDAGLPIPRPPESAILLLGAVRQRPAVDDGALVIRPTGWATLSFDHRFIDGAAGAAFLQDVQVSMNNLTASAPDLAGDSAP